MIKLSIIIPCYNESESVEILVNKCKQIQDSDIEIILVGENLNFKYINQLEDKIEILIKRKVSFYLASKFLSDKKHIILYDEK